MLSEAISPQQQKVISLTHERNDQITSTEKSTVPRLHAESHQSIGNRDEQEDTHWNSQDANFQVFLVADGAGGLDNGAKASYLARKAWVDYISGKSINDSQGTFSKRDKLDSVSLCKRLFDAGHRAVVEAVRQKNDQKTRMASTEVVAVFETSTQSATGKLESNAYIAHAGDSRAYLFRQSGDIPQRWYDPSSRRDQLSQLTKDHTLAQQLVDAGLLTEDEKARSEHNNVLMKCLGKSDDPGNGAALTTLEPTITKVPLQPGDLLVLASDGLIVPHSRLATVLDTVRAQNNSPAAIKQAEQQLVQECLALKPGSSDNITITIIAYEGLKVPEKFEDELAEAKKRYQNEVMKTFSIRNMLGISRPSFADRIARITRSSFSSAEIQQLINRIKQGESGISLIKEQEEKVTIADLELRAAELPVLFQKLKNKKLVAESNLVQKIAQTQATLVGLRKNPSLYAQLITDTDRMLNELLTAQRIKEDYRLIHKVYEHLAAHSANPAEFQRLSIQYQRITHTVDGFSASMPQYSKSFTDIIQNAQRNSFDMSLVDYNYPASIVYAANTQAHHYRNRQHFGLFGLNSVRDKAITNSDYLKSNDFASFLHNHKAQLGLNIPDHQIPRIIQRLGQSDMSLFEYWRSSQLTVDYLQQWASRLTQQGKTKEAHNVQNQANAAAQKLKSEFSRVDWRSVAHRIQTAAQKK